VAAGKAEPRGTWRRGLAVGVSEASKLDGTDVVRRAQLLARSLRGDRVPLREEPGFWFDPDYAVFLEEVGKRVPANASVAVLAPSWPDVYAYQAVYQLAPRRVVDRRLAADAAYVAVYRAGAGPGEEAIAHGTLRKR
jgi:hypothetical protein